MKSTRILKEEPTGIAVDLLRGLLAILVLIAHGLESAEIMSKESMSATLAITIGHGGFWVGGFFVLSGFCVHRSIMTQHERGVGFIKTYLLARLTRIYPVYLIALLLTVFIQGLFGEFTPGERLEDPGRLLGHLFMIQGVSGTIHELKPAWSLTYEVVYYFGWPLILWACAWKIWRSFILAVCVSLITGSALFVSWKMLGAGNSILLPMAMIAAQSLLWLGGALLAQTWDLANRYASSWLGVISLIGVALAFGVQAILKQADMPQWTQIIAGYVALPCWLGLILGANSWKHLLTWKRTSTWLGLLSYPLYILHQVLLDLAVTVARLFHLSFSFLEAVVLLLSFVAGLMIVAGVPLEAVFLTWRSTWLNRYKRTALKLEVKSVIIGS